MAGLAARLTLLISESDGPYDLLQTMKEVAAQNLKMIVYTNPGERIMDLDFGVGIKRFLFRQNVRETHDILKNRIGDQVRKYLPYVSIVDISVDSVLTNPTLPENFISLRLAY